MPRRVLEEKSVPIEIKASPRLVSYLEDVVKEGLHGRTVPAVAAALLGLQVQHMIETDFLKQRSARAGSRVARRTRGG
jgi:hypothetical protein